MVSRPVRFAILCAVVLFGASEWEQARAAMMGKTHQPCCSEAAEEAEFDQLEVDCLIGYSPVDPLDIVFVSHDLVGLADLLREQSEHSSHRLRGPPCPNC